MGQEMKVEAERVGKWNEEVREKNRACFFRHSKRLGRGESMAWLASSACTTAVINC